MSELVFLGAQIGARMTAGAGAAWNALGDLNSRVLKLADFLRIVGKQANRLDTESFEGFGGKIIIAGVGIEAELAIRFDGIKTAVLKLVGFQFVQQTDAASLLRKIEDDTARLLGDLAERIFELRTAIAALGSKYVACQTLRMDSNEGRLPTRRGFAVQLSANDSDGLLAWSAAFNSKDAERPVASGQLGLRHDSGLP